MKLDIGGLIRRAGNVITHPILQALGDFYVLPKSTKASQVLLSMQYKQMLALHLPLPTFDDIEFRAFSQYGEDGILLYIFSLIGTTNKQCVEVCGGDAIYDNTTNLIVNHGWKGLFFDGSEEKIRKGQRFYARCLDTQLWPPKLRHAWITAGNINALLQENGCVGEIDLLSLDMDGVDYWVWKAIECINPRVVVLEYNSALGPDSAVTVPYNLDFKWKGNDSLLRYRVSKVANMFLGKSIERIDNYFGASLSAFVKLGKQKGYRLVGCERYGFNAFFVRSDIGEEILPEIAPAECFGHPYSKHAMEVRSQNLVDKEWIEV